MVELKISQGAKPGHGGVLPAAKVSEEISRTRGVPMGQDCISPSAHSAFSTLIGMMQFIAEMRGSPVAGPPASSSASAIAWSFLYLYGDVLETGIYPDFIVVDGAEGTPAPPRWSSSTISA